MKVCKDYVFVCLSVSLFVCVCVCVSVDLLSETRENEKPSWYQSLYSGKGVLKQLKVFSIDIG